ncbi:MAG: hypothetical protein ACKO2P_21760 [Planctomycetota bacterium]
MFRRLRTRRSTATPARTIAVQTLESRQLLAAAVTAPQQSITEARLTIAETQPPVTILPQPISLPITGGLVNVAVSRLGEITVSGDASDNFVVVDISAGQLDVTSWGTGTQFQTAGKRMPTESLSLPLPKQVRSLAINLRGGNDTLRVRFQGDITFSRDFSVVLGDGDDFLDISAMNADVKFGNDASLDFGNGNDRSVITLAGGASLIVTRDLNVRTGSGSDSLLVIDSDTVPADALEFPERLRSIPNTTFVPQSQPIRAGRDILVDLGGGDDQLTLLNTEAGRDITLKAFLGTDAAALGNVRAGRGLLMNDLESQLLQNVTVVGTCTMRTGSVSSRTVADQLQLGRLDAVLGGGNDKFALGENVNVRLSSVVNGGGGSNVLYTGKLQPRINFRSLMPGLKPEETLQMVAGILSAVPRPAWSIQVISEPVWPMPGIIIPFA